MRACSRLRTRIRRHSVSAVGPTRAEQLCLNPVGHRFLPLFFADRLSNLRLFGFRGLPPSNVAHCLSLLLRQAEHQPFAECIGYALECIECRIAVGFQQLAQLGRINPGGLL